MIPTTTKTGTAEIAEHAKKTKILCDLGVLCGST